MFDNYLVDTQGTVTCVSRSVSSIMHMTKDASSTVKRFDETISKGAEINVRLAGPHQAGEKGQRMPPSNIHPSRLLTNGSSAHFAVGRFDDGECSVRSNAKCLMITAHPHAEGTRGRRCSLPKIQKAPRRRGILRRVYARAVEHEGASINKELSALWKPHDRAMRQTPPYRVCSTPTSNSPPKLKEIPP